MRPYWVVVNGQRFQVLASEHEAKTRGLEPVTVPNEPETKQRRVANKQRTVNNK